MRTTKLFLISAATILQLACGSHDAAHEGGAAPATPAPTSVPLSTQIAKDAIYVVNGEDATVSVIDPANGDALGTIKLENVTFPHHIYLSPDRAKLAVAVPGHDLSGGHSAAAAPPAGGGEHGGGHNASSSPSSSAAGGGGAVLVLDAATGATIKSRRLDAPNHNAIFSSDSKEIWTAQLVDAGTVLVLDASTLETKKTINVGKVPAEVTFSPNGKRAFVANGTSNDVTVIDVETKAVLATIPVDREPVGAWPGSDGMMYVDCEVAKTVKAIDPETLKVVRSYSLGFTPGFVAVPPTRLDELWVTDADAGKIVFNTTSADERKADLATAAGAHAIAFTPDGARGFVTNQLAGSLSIIDPAAKAMTKTVSVGRKPNGIAYRAQ